MAEHDIERRLRALIDREVAKRRVGNIVVGIQSTDGIDIAIAAGFSDAGRSAAMTVDTPYYLASITKMYTATVVMRLAATEDLGLDTPIASYLPSELIDGIHVLNGTDCSQKVTVSQLLAQTSGLADYFEGKPRGGTSLAEDLKAGRDRALSIEDIVEIARGLSPEFAPGVRGGGRAHYSDTNYALLGAIVEAVTASDLPDIFDEMIFTPLGLADTFVFDQRRVQSAPAVMYANDRVVDIPLAMSSFAPDGGVVATVADSLAFLRGFFGGELVTADQIQLMTSRWNRIFFPLQYGYGVMRYQLPRWMSPFSAPPELIGHSGSTGSFAFFDPKRDVYLAGTLNQMDDPGRPYRVMTKIIDLVDAP